MSARKYISLSFLCLCVFSIYPLLGAVTLNWEELISNEQSVTIITQLRMPRLILLVITGGSLALIGAAYQVLFRNSLAEPYVLGISSAVTLGLVLSQVILRFDPNSIVATSLGLLLAVIISILLMSLNKLWNGNSNRLVLFGMGLNFLFSSLVFIILSYHFQSMGSGSMRWMFGQIPWPSWKSVVTLTAILVPLNIVLIAFSRPLDAIGLGDAIARTLGYRPVWVRNWVILLSSVMLGVLVPLTGAIGFVGLVVPHAIRLSLKPSNNRSLFVVAFLIGGVFLVLSDLVSRLILPPFEFPIGIVTTIIGAPFFLFLLWRTQR